jgi:excisionase family DNA binding protein
MFQDVHRKTNKQLLSIEEFCLEHNLSRGTFYRLLKSGNGPRLTKIGRRRLISREAALDWRKDMEYRSL